MCSKALAIVTVTLLLAAGAAASSVDFLYNFGSQSGDGYYPYAGVIADSKGNFYGTTYDGGANSSYGAVYELSPGKGGYTETTLYSFNAKPDGYYPYGALARDKSGNLYGATYYGGANGYGRVYELKKSGKIWKETVLYDFAGGTADGYYPQSQLVFDAKGNLYGTTTYGGAHSGGTVYQLQAQKSGKFKYNLLYSFAGGSTDGYYPQLGPLFVAKNGYFYGTTLYGGSSYNDGTVYELFNARGVWVEKVIYAFTGGKAGQYPYGGVTMNSKGVIFGATYNGGVSDYGAVYRLTQAKNKTWAHLTIYSFLGGTNDGAYPYAGLVLDQKGDIWGTTYQGGTSNGGILFELTPSGKTYKEKVIDIYANSGDGYYPHDTPYLDSKGHLFGTTTSGGTKGGGTVWEIIP